MSKQNKQIFMAVQEDPNSPNNELKNIETGNSEFTWNFPEDFYSPANKLKAIETGKMSKDPNSLANELKDTETGRVSKDPNSPTS